MSEEDPGYEIREKIDKIIEEAKEKYWYDDETCMRLHDLSYIIPIYLLKAKGVKWNRMSDSERIYEVIRIMLVGIHDDCIADDATVEAKKWKKVLKALVKAHKG